MDYERAKQIIEHMIDKGESINTISVLAEEELEALYKARRAIESCMGRGEEGEDY